MHKAKTSDIQIGDRFRKDYGDIDELVASIQRFGILQPVIINRNMELMAGGRRMTAALRLELDEVPVVFRDEVDPLTLREIELEENIQRLDLAWHEKAALTAEIHRLKQTLYGDSPTSRYDEGWSMRDTAKAIGKGLATVSTDLALARLIEVMPELKKESNWRNAMVAADRELERLERERAVRIARRRFESAGSTGLDTIWHGEWQSLIHLVPDASIDCIIIDPPYGTEAEGMHFDDSPETAILGLKALLPELKRVGKSDVHVWTFFGIKLWTETLSIFSQYFQVDPVPAVWIKDTEGLVDFSKRMSHSWEPILFCSNGDRSLAYKRNNVFQFASVASRERANAAEKPPDLIAELIRLSTREGETILDTFSGSGVVACEARRAGRHFIGIEKDKNQWNASIIRLVDLERHLSGSGESEANESEGVEEVDA